MIESKRFLGKMDLDSSPYKIAKEDYIDALNITKNAIAQNSDISITNLVGNRLVDYELPEGSNKTIGVKDYFPYMIYMVYNSNGKHSILEYNSEDRTITKVFENLTDSDNVDVLGFTLNDKITSINILFTTEGVFCFFIDSLKRPTYINITRFKNGEYTPVTRDILDVCTIPPLTPPLSLYGNDTSRKSNNLRNKFFRFKYRWVYDDNQKSVFSPISKMPMPLNLLEDTFTNVITNNNVISIQLNSGEKNVKEIELAVSYVNKTNSWSDFALVESIKKSDYTSFGVSVSTAPNQIIPEYNNGTISFSGIVIPDTEIEITIKEISSGDDILLATYTTLDGDTITDVLNELLSKLTPLIGTYIEAAYISGTNSLVISYVSDDYEFASRNVGLDLPPTYSADNLILSYDFYNDSTYPTIDISESIQLFDYVPDEADAQDMPNGNVLMYGGITEGYDRNLVTNVDVNILQTAVTADIPTGNLTAVYRYLPHYVAPHVNRRYWRVEFNGSPAIGTEIKIEIKNPSAVLETAALYTTVANDSITSIINGLIASYDTYGLAEYWSKDSVATIFYYEINGNPFNEVIVTITPPETSSDDNPIPTWKWNTERNVGIVYFDKKGKTNGVVYNTKVSFPSYEENGDDEILLPYINIKVYHRPFDWAYSYQFVITKEPTRYIYWQTIDAKEDSEYIYLDVSNFVTNAQKNPNTANVLSYSFQDGDRLRVIKNMSDSTVYDDTHDASIEGLVVNPIISGVQIGGVGSTPSRSFLKIKNIAPLSSIDFVGDKTFLIEIYRVSQQLPSGDNAVYYELGEQYSIINPTETNRFHSGGTTDQTASTAAETNIYEGDSYFRLRTIFASEDAAATSYATFPCQDRNVVDIYNSEVSSLDGRPNIIDTNAKRQYFGALVRFGQAYQPNTNINGLNRFYANNFDEYDYSYGNIVRLKVRDRAVRVFQNYKVGIVPLFNQISKNADGTQLLVVTDKLLNPIQYYSGDYGIGDNAESLASFTFADYFTSNVKGAICRVSNDGVQPISIMYKVDSWATQRLPLQIGNYKVYGVFDQRLNNYIISLEAAGEGNAAVSISFNENTNMFESFISLYPDMMCSIGTLLISFKNGELYTHDDTENYNTFFGVTYNSYIKGVFNQSVMQKKTFLSLTELASQVWDCPEIETNMNSYGEVKQQSSLITEDFELKETEYHTSLLRDSNSIGGIIEGDALKGNFISVIFRANNPTNLVSLDEVNLKYINSPLNNR